MVKPDTKDIDKHDTKERGKKRRKKRRKKRPIKVTNACLYRQGKGRPKCDPRKRLMSRISPALTDQKPTRPPRFRYEQTDVLKGESIKQERP
jgi:hypothetical protein